MHMQKSVVRFPQAFRSQLTHLCAALATKPRFSQCPSVGPSEVRREAAFPGFSSVSRATGSCLVATLKGAQQVKAHESGPKHLAQRSRRAFVKAQPCSGPGTEARMLDFQNSNTQAQTQAQSRAFNLTPAPPVIAVAARRADVAARLQRPAGRGGFREGCGWTVGCCGFPGA